MPRADRNGNHVGRDGLAEPDAGIEAGRNHVDQRVVDDDLDVDVGEGLQELRDDRQQHQLRRLPRGIEAKRAGRLAAKAVEIFQRVVDITECRTDPLEQPRAGFGQRDTAGGAVDQPHVQPFLDIAQRVAERGRGDTEFGRRGAKATMPGDRQESREVGRVDPH